MNGSIEQTGFQRHLSSYEEASTNYVSTVHLDFAFDDKAKENEVQLFHLIMHKMDVDWPFVVDPRFTSSSTIIYKYSRCCICLGRVWRSQPFKPLDVKRIMEKLASQIGLTFRYLLTSSHSECMEFKNTCCEDVNAKDGVLDLYDVGMYGGVYEYRSKR